MNRILFAVIVLTLCCLGPLMGCSVNPSEFSNTQANDLAGRLTYARDARTGLCFAMMASRKPFDTHQTGFAITNVPCSKVWYLLVH